jgi:hypothetical protein
MPIAADYVSLYEAAYVERFLHYDNYPILKKLYDEYLYASKMYDLAETNPHTFTIRHVHPNLMKYVINEKNISYTRYLDTRVPGSINRLHEQQEQ